MKEQRWTLWVRDERGKRHRGIVSYGDRPPRSQPQPPYEFRIALLTSPASVKYAPGTTAICIPHLARSSAVLDASRAPLSPVEEAANLRRGDISMGLHAQYRSGVIVLPAGTIDATRVFRSERTRVDFEHLALLLVDQRHAETIAPYLAIIRHELRIPPGANALLALEARLTPADARERAPGRAPAIRRLKLVRKRLGIGAQPDVTLDELTDDLRFLRLFERAEHVLRRDALDRLLGEVIGRPPPPPARKRSRSAIVPLRREDA